MYTGPGMPVTPTTMTADPVQGNQKVITVFANCPTRIGYYSKQAQGQSEIAMRSSLSTFPGMNFFSNILYPCREGYCSYAEVNWTPTIYSAGKSGTLCVRLEGATDKSTFKDR